MMLNRTDTGRLLYVLAAGCVSAILYLSDHNTRQIGGPPQIVSQEWMLLAKTLTCAAVTIGAYWHPLTPRVPVQASETEPTG